MNKEQQENARLNLKSWRKENKWSQEEMAEKMNVSLGHYYHLERGTRNISMTMATSISRIFNVTFDQIFLKKN